MYLRFIKDYVYKQTLTRLDSFDGPLQAIKRHTPVHSGDGLQ